MPKSFAWEISTGGGGEGGEPTGPAGGSLKGEYPNPTLAEEAVKAEYVATNAIVAAAIKADAVTELKIKEGAVTATRLATDSVIAAKIKEEAVETAKIKDGAVTEAKLGAASVVAAKIGSEAVETAKIKAKAVTTAKIEDANITAALIATNAVEEAKIKAKAVSKEKLSTEVQEMIEPKVFERGFAIAGEVKAETYPGFFVKLGTGEEKKLIGVQGVLLEGTSVKVEVLKNGEGIAGYKSTEVEFTKTAAKVSSTKALANEDLITIKPSGGVGTPKGLTVTLFVESVK